MAQAARQEGIALRIISATRNFAAQQRIWEAKWRGRRKVNGQVLNIMVPNPTQRALKILEYSSMPGTSRHHWGTDIDLNALTNAYFTSGERVKKVYDWLQAHAAEYGFCQVYTEQGKIARTVTRRRSGTGAICHWRASSCSSTMRKSATTI